MRLLPRALPILFAASLGFAASAQSADAPYEVIVWADASYDTSGALTALEFPQAKDYAPALLDNLRARIAARPLTPKLDGDVPATYETGVRVTMTVTPETGSVKVDDITDMPLVMRMTTARFTENMASGASSWDGRVIGSCMVTVKGRCGAVEILSDASDVPDEARRIAKRALGEWRFEPQKVGGKPVEGRAVMPFVFERSGVSRPQLRGR